MKVLLTRPVDQNADLSAVCEARGLEWLALPLISIEPLPELSTATVLQLDQYDAIIFISANAVKYGMSFIDQYWPQLPQLSWYAVGHSTAKALASWDQQASYPVIAGSEGLLDLISQAPETEQRYLIIKGEGGRELLAAKLTEHKTTVTELEVYRRRPVDYPAEVLDKIFSELSSGYVIITSGEALRHFDALCPDPVKTEITLVVPSQRLLKLAENLPYTSILNAGSAENDQILSCIVEDQQGPGKIGETDVR